MLSWVARPAGADVFVLKSGGRVSGEWINREQSPQETFVVRTAIGLEVTLYRGQVEQVVQQSPEEREYEKIRPTISDTVDGHLKLAKWCLDRGLVSARRTHMERVIQLDPDHAEARNALGYRQVRGEWMTRDEEMASRGMKFYKGRYRTLQEIELWEQEERETIGRNGWQANLKRWRSWLGTDKTEAAKAKLAEIRDPLAVEALTEALADEQFRPVKLLYIESLARIESSAAIKTLVDLSLGEADQEVRLTCLDHLVKTKPPDALTMYIVALRDKDNVKVNRAAVALRNLGYPSAIGPLIDALVTEHKYAVVTGSPGQMSSTFNRNGGGGGGMSFGGGGPKIIKRQVPNQEVLTALIALSGGHNYNFDTKAWKYWHATQRKAQAIDARRD